MESIKLRIVKETTARPKSRPKPKSTNGSSMQYETPARGDVLQLAPKKYRPEAPDLGQAQKCDGVIYYKHVYTLLAFR